MVLSVIAGWHEVHRREPTWPLLSHDEVVADKVATIANLLWKLGAATDRERVEVVISELSRNRDLVNLNHGGSGRGRELLSRQQLQRIERLWSAFASPDPVASERRIDEVRQTVRERTASVVRAAMDEAAAIGNAEPAKTVALLTGAHLRLDGLLRAAPEDMELLKLLASVYGSLGRSFQQRSDGRARQYLDSAISVYARINAAEGIEHSQPRDLECIRQLASLYAESGRLLLVQDDRDDASRYFASAAAVYDQILQQTWTAAVLEEMAQNFLLQAETYISIGDPAYGTADYRRALSILAQLYAVDPKSKEILLTHLRAYRGLADAFATLGDRDSEIDALRSTMAVLGQLEALEPGLSWKKDIKQVAKRLPRNLLARVLGAVRAVRSVVFDLGAEPYHDSDRAPRLAQPESLRPPPRDLSARA